jgi:hypothetical protein
LIIESGEKVGMDSEIRTLLLLNFAIMCVLFAGFLLLSNKRYRLAAEVSSRKAELDEEAML